MAAWLKDGKVSFPVFWWRQLINQGWINSFFFLIFKFKFKFIDFEKIKFKFKFIDFKKTKFKFKFKFIDFEKSKFKFKFIDFAKVEFKFKFINNLWADSNSNSKFKFNPTPTFYTKDSKRILQFAPTKSQSRSRRCVLANRSQGLREGGSGGTSYPGPGLGGLKGPGRVQVNALSFGMAP